MCFALINRKSSKVCLNGYWLHAQLNYLCKYDMVNGASIDGEIGIDDFWLLFVEDPHDIGEDELVGDRSDTFNLYRTTLDPDLDLR